MKKITVIIPCLNEEDALPIYYKEMVLAVTNEGNSEVERAADYVIYIPQTNRYFTNSLAIIPLQLFGYYISVGRGCDVDKPRNLAKSVTVE